MSSYMITWADTKENGKQRPADHTRKSFAELLQKEANGFFKTSKKKGPSGKVLTLDHVVVFKEWHKGSVGTAPLPHYHAVVSAPNRWAWKTFAKKLRGLGIYVNFSSRVLRFCDGIGYFAFCLV
jgi:hypothetical protein